jgi:peptidoglycan/xylan/chitin deacetylase (PgdA/CDA1 family)
MTGAPGIKRRLKEQMGRLLFATPAGRRMLADRAYIMAFHRVDDSAPPNPITCTSGELAEYCDFFKRHFDVVSLHELLNRLERGEPVSHLLALTFDDGYWDNSEVAAPILAARGLPATFFISSDFIATDRIPWWDVEWGVRTRWMNWDQVRSLRARGFDIGAHTCNHVDLSEVHGDEARREIAGSKERLERELNEPVTLFSYPYGRAHQISEQNRALVRSLGFRCCPSSYGGCVRAGDDPFRLRRQPISPWFISPWQFGWEMATNHSLGRD